MSPVNWTVPEDGEAPALAGFLRGRVEGSWKRVKQRIRDGAFSVDGAVVTDPGTRLKPGQVVAEASPGRAAQGRGARSRRPTVEVVYQDSQVVVIDKPVGISTVPYDDNETDTAQSRLRYQLGTKKNRQATVLKVHRIDKATSGLVIFARTPTAHRHLKDQLRVRSIARSYLCIVHGQPRAETITSWLVPDRGDGLRGSTNVPKKGRRAVTHVELVERLGPVSLLRCKLETGRTHQIRIHLAEAGHPLVGEPVYIRRFVRRGGTPIEAPRMMLHATELGFEHPTEGRPIHLESPMPEAFEALLEQHRPTRR